MTPLFSKKKKKQITEKQTIKVVRMNGPFADENKVGLETATINRNDSIFNRKRTCSANEACEIMLKNR